MNKAAMKADFEAMLKFVDKTFPYGFKKSPTSQKTPRVRFDSLAVGVHLALKQKPDLKVKDVKWIGSQEFGSIITSGGQNAPRRLKSASSMCATNFLAPDSFGDGLCQERLQQEG
ncbi:MAG: hypothetical protein IPL52_09410 [Flavobacteriales bacterium]|nr:hypothetical protein [Flavobacteriales bacterium]